MFCVTEIAQLLGPCRPSLCSTQRHPTSQAPGESGKIRGKCSVLHSPPTCPSQSKAKWGLPPPAPSSPKTSVPCLPLQQMEGGRGFAKEGMKEGIKKKGCSTMKRVYDLTPVQFVSSLRFLGIKGSSQPEMVPNPLHPSPNCHSLMQEDYFIVTDSILTRTRWWASVLLVSPRWNEGQWIQLRYE